MRREHLIYFGLFAITVAVFWPVANGQFLNLDDWAYVTENLHVRQGLSWENVVWAFGATEVYNWHPLTWLSHMLDCQLFGLSAAGPHLVNLGFHAINSVILCVWLRRITGELWPSVFVAALFALHPLHVESVAWISERKDVLSTFFGLLALLFYCRYVSGQRLVVSGASAEREGLSAMADRQSPIADEAGERESSRLAAQEKEGLMGGSDAIGPGVSAAPGDQARPGEAPGSRQPTLDYLLALVFFALGLMSKPMLVTWPFVMMLLDVWPLNRIRISDFGFRSAELTQRRKGAKGVESREPRVEDELPKPEGCSTVDPRPSTALGVFAALREKIPFFVLAAASCAVTLFAQGHGGAIVDVSSIAPFDRFQNALVAYVTYLIKTIWPSGLAAYYLYSKDLADWQVTGSLAVLVVISIGVLRQMRRRPYLAFGWLWFVGTLVPVIGLVQVGGQSMADRYMYIPSIGLFVMLAWAAKDLTKGLGVPTWAEVSAAIGILTGCAVVSSVQVRYWRDSVSLFRHATEVTSKNTMAEFLLGDALIKEREVDEGLIHLNAAAAINPSYAPVHAKLADLLCRRGRFEEAIAHYREVLRYRPNTPTVLNNLAWMLATNPDPSIRDGSESVRLAERSCQLTGYKLAVCVGTLGAAYAEAGRFDDAIAAAGKAQSLASASGQGVLVSKNAELLKLYQSHQPYRENPRTGEPIRSDAQ